MVWALKRAAIPPCPIAHLVLIGLADHAHDDGSEARPSVATLARYARCSERTVHTKLRMLEAAGLIRRGDQRAVEHLPRNRRPVVYDLNLSKVHGVQEVQASDHAAPSGVNDGASRGERRGTAGVNAAADRTTLEPSIEGGVSSRVTSPVRDEGSPSPFNDLGGNNPPETPAPLPRPERCRTHQLDDIPPPCGACKVARETLEVTVRARARQDAERERHARREAARMARLDIDACTLCDEDGRDGTGLPCTHDPGAAERARRGAAEVRAALAGGAR